MKKKLSWEEAVLWLRDQPDKIELVKACYYDDPLLDAVKRYYKSNEWKEIRNLLPARAGKVLDLGAGRGISSYAFAMDGWDTVALEPDKSDIVGAGAIRSVARDTGLNIEVREEWGESLPFPDNTFDVVHGRQVLHHADDLAQICREMSRVLKKGGLFIATREHVISRHSDLKVFQDNHPLHNLYGGENAYLLREYKTSIKNADLQLKKVLGPLESDINYAPFGIDELKRNVLEMFRRFGMDSFLKHVLSYKMMWDCFIMAYSLLDKSPGRLYSFVAFKSEVGQ